VVSSGLVVSVFAHSFLDYHHTRTAHGKIAHSLSVPFGSPIWVQDSGYSVDVKNNPIKGENSMSDFVIKTTAKPGESPHQLRADDVIMSPDGTKLRYIEAFTHDRKDIPLDQVKNVWRERRGWQGGPAFHDKEIPMGWKRPK
jgi:hypothetical protein